MAIPLPVGTLKIAATPVLVPPGPSPQQITATHTMPVDVTMSASHSEQQTEVVEKVTSAAKEKWVTETIHKHWGQTFLNVETLVQIKTSEQDLLIFRNPIFGKVLVLDGAIQITEKDEFVYQEMMAHIPLLAHPNPKKVLIIGGGDGGILREVLRHATVEKAHLVEIDGLVIERSKEHLAHISRGAFDDPRAKITVEDGCKFVKETNEKYDVIICDSTDPVGPGAVLFTSEFYGDCHKLLNTGGIFVNQNGVPFVQPEELPATFVRRKEHFQDVGFYVAPVPTYQGGFMTLGWATDSKELRNVSVEELTNRLERVKGSLKYYNPEIHKACFALPNYIKQLIPSA